MAVSLGAILEGPDTKALEGPVTQVRLNDVFCYTYNSSKHWMGGGGVCFLVDIMLYRKVPGKLVCFQL